MVSYKDDIMPLMADSVGCMNALDWPLDDIAFMTNPAGGDSFPDFHNARTTYARLSTTNTARKMPRGGPYWTEAQLALYREWMDGGFAP